MSKFISQICRICGACRVTDPYFCSSMHGADSKMFANILKHTIYLKYNDEESFSDLILFSAMVGRYCNNKQGCPFRTPECDLLDTAIKCYEMYIGQSGLTLTTKYKCKLFELFSGVDLQYVGDKFIVPKKPLKGLSKKSKRRINRICDKAISSVNVENKKAQNTGKNDSKAAVIKVKSKCVNTTFFCNEDEAWQQKIDTILGVNTKTNEANN